ncbi:MAG TPA: hypothetical protein VK540_04795 [Polyangiaceae bacterium]|jgi:hypothetical protein|nr:hypothetical protein [Polyangiaceae bacterium]
MSATDARSLRLRGLGAVALGVAVVAGGVYRGALAAEIERSLMDDSSVAPAKDKASLSPSPPLDPFANRSRPSASILAHAVKIVVSLEGSLVSRYDLTIDRAKRSAIETVVSTRVDESRGRPPVIALRPGHYALHIVADLGGAALAFEVKEDSNEPIAVNLARFGTVRGALVDARSQRPIQAELEFRVIPKDARTGRSLTSTHLSAIKHRISTDEHGEFTLRRIEPGNLGVQLRDPVTERPIRILQRDERGEVTQGAGYLGELLPGQDLDLGFVRGKLGYDFYR